LVFTSPLVGDVAAKLASGGRGSLCREGSPPPGEQSLADLPHKGGGEYLTIPDVAGWAHYLLPPA